MAKPKPWQRVPNSAKALLRADRPTARPMETDEALVDHLPRCLGVYLFCK
jgi:hypothetical protein